MYNNTSVIRDFPLQKVSYFTSPRPQLGISPLLGLAWDMDDLYTSYKK